MSPVELADAIRGTVELCGAWVSAVIGDVDVVMRQLFRAEMTTLTTGAAPSG